MEVDWWALGILIYEMHAGIDPFHDDNAVNIYKNIILGDFEYP
jgi:serine/threonine protein kinase